MKRRSFGRRKKKKGTLQLRCSILSVAPTSTSCRPSKKCLFFFLSLRYVVKEREKKIRTVLNIIIIMRINARELNEQTAYSSSRSLSPDDSYSTRKKYVHTRVKVGLTRIFSLLPMNTYCCLLSLYIFFHHIFSERTKKKCVNARKQNEKRRPPPFLSLSSLHNFQEEKKDF
jgi:hypothetical protein